MADEVHTYKDATLTIGGAAFGSTDVTVGPSDWPDELPPSTRPFEGVSLPAAFFSTDASIELDHVQDLLMALFPSDPPGASRATLAKRVLYGGRKGRSALRRLFKHALPIEMNFGPDSPIYLRGDAIMIPTKDGGYELRVWKGRFRYRIPPSLLEHLGSYQYPPAPALEP